MGADLPVTIIDVEGIATLLCNRGRCAYPLEQVQLLVGPGAGRDDVLKAPDELATQVKAHPKATAVVYFSGHGTETPDYQFVPYGYNVTDFAMSERRLAIYADGVSVHGGMNLCRDRLIRQSPQLASPPRAVIGSRASDLSPGAIIVAPPGSIG